MLDAAELWNEYRATEYRAETPVGTISIYVDQPTPLLDALLDLHDAACWAFITADNPGSRQLSAAENEARQAQLQQELRARGLPMFPGRGIGRDPAWKPEASLLIVGLSQTEAVLIGRTFGQNAIVCGARGQAAELVDCRPNG